MFASAGDDKIVRMYVQIEYWDDALLTLLQMVKRRPQNKNPKWREAIERLASSRLRYMIMLL